MRAEKAYTTSHLVTTSSVIEGDYFTLYPTLHLSYKFNEVSELQLSYSKRTRRPESEDLNPFPEYQDPRNVRVGNPNLLPEYTHSIELGCKWQNRQVSIVPSIYYQYTYNSFTALTQVLNDSTLLTTSANLSHDRAAGVECLVSGSAGTLLTGTLSANVFSSTIDASNLGYSARKTILAGIGSATVNVNLGAATLLQVNSNYSSSRLTPQGEYRPRFVANLGMRQELFDGKCAMVMTLTDLFNTLRRTREVNIPSMQQTVMNKRDGRIFYVGFTYHFGRPPKKSKEDAIRYDEGL